jgi:hypothetical protein
VAALLAPVNLEADVNHRSSASDADIIPFIIIIVAAAQFSLNIDLSAYLWDAVLTGRQTKAVRLLFGSD